MHVWTDLASSESEAGATANAAVSISAGKGWTIAEVGMTWTTSGAIGKRIFA
jgi:hypothetical protein